MPLTIDRGGSHYLADAAERTRFRAQRWLRLPAFLDRRVLERVNRALGHSVFAETRHPGVTVDSTDLRVIGGAVSEMLVLLCNDTALLRAIEQITGCAPLTRFNGSIYRMLPDGEHRQDWHDDLIDGRVLTLSINIGLSGYDGGLLEIRDRATRGPIVQLPNRTAGDAVLFELDRSLEHRVTPVTSGVKTAFAGWFRRGTPLRDELRQASIELDSRLEIQRFADPDSKDSGIQGFRD
jgi:hypothetical protein